MALCFRAFPALFRPFPTLPFQVVWDGIIGPPKSNSKGPPKNLKGNSGGPVSYDAESLVSNDSTGSERGGGGKGGGKGGKDKANNGEDLLKIKQRLKDDLSKLLLTSTGADAQTALSKDVYLKVSAPAR